MKNDRNKSQIDWNAEYDISKIFSPSEIKYSPEIIQVFAKKLYDKADAVTAYYSFLSIFIGCIFLNFMIDDKILLAFLGGLSGVIGYYIGQDKAFKYRLDAQIALCQVQIETNTRISSNREKENDNSSPKSSSEENSQYDQDDAF